MQETATGEKKYFLLKLIAPRPTFAADMTVAEMKVMQDHAAYLKTFLDNGTIIVTGPVLDPAGSWGVAIAEIASEAAARSLIDQDPTTRSGLGFRWEIYPMLRAAVRK
jgi:uncharacterized protein YciI